MSQHVITIQVDDVDDARFIEEIGAALTEGEGITIRTGGRKFHAEVVANEVEGGDTTYEQARAYLSSVGIDPDSVRR